MRATPAQAAYWERVRRLAMGILDRNPRLGGPGLNARQRGDLAFFAAKALAAAEEPQRGLPLEWPDEAPRPAAGPLGP